jgi:4-alpha-glucanotransferase
VSTLPDALAELAAAYGVATRFTDWRDQPVEVPEKTIVEVLRALGVDAATPRAARVALERHRTAHWWRMLPGSLVVREGEAPEFWVHVPHGDPVELWIEQEDGALRHDVARRSAGEPVAVRNRLMARLSYQLPLDLPLGWHRIHARSGDRTASAALVVTPPYLGVPARLAGRRVWGLMTQLYSVRSRRSWGLGDLRDLADLVSWGGRRLGAGFVLVNPLHAAEPVTPMEPSPYLPSSRRFANPLYLRVEDVPEFAYLPAAELARVRQDADALRPRNRTDGLLERDPVWEAKRTALELVHQVPRSPGRQAAYEDFLAREGEGLVDFATWCVLMEEHGLPWADWPAELQDPRSEAVAAVRAAQADRVDFHCWLQWLIDEQLATAQQGALDAGMPVGVVHDLAVGVHPQGADAWALRHVLAEGISVGAPPDAFNQQGQDWSQPPWRPDRLADLGYAPYRDMLRTVLRHAGALRVDHVLGLFRLWWIPSGQPPSAGTYVRYDHEALVGILALEALRAGHGVPGGGALVVGEDLGTVEPWVREYLAERGLFGTSILWFERDRDGRPLPHDKWRELCLATVATHDLPPAAGYLAGSHIDLRERLDLLTRPAAEERREDEAHRREWQRLLRELGLLRPGAGEQEVVEALHRFLVWTPARLLGVALTDAVGDRRTQNQPGTSNEYPNWRVPLADGAGRPALLEDLVDAPRVRSLAQVFTSL